MPQPNTKRRTKRVVMLLAIGLLGAVVALLLTLLYMLYWMKAPVPLPNPELGMLRGHDAFLVVRPNIDRHEDREALRRMLSRLLAASPNIVRQAARYGLAEERAGTCPVQVTLSLRAESLQEIEWTATVSLGRYRGAFRLAERALRRQASRGDIPYARRSYLGDSLYEATRSVRSAPGALGIWQATGIVGSGIEAVASVFGSLESGAAPEDAELPDPAGVFGRGRVLRPDPVLAAWLRHLIGESADLGPLRGAFQTIEIDLEAKDGGLLLVEAVAPWREGANRTAAVRAVSELLQLPHESGHLHEFNVHPGDRALEVRVLVHFAEIDP